MMLTFENTEVYGWKAAIRGMRNPLESWSKSDSYETHIEDDRLQEAVVDHFIGDNDIDLMKRLICAGASDRKFLRMINVSVDINAPRYWWTEFDTYKVGTVRNSCSTMHKMMSHTYQNGKHITMGDFSIEGLCPRASSTMQTIVQCINDLINDYSTTRQDMLIQVKKVLPESWNQKATVCMNYEVIRNMYHQRKHHTLPEWHHDFVEWVEDLPYAKELIIGEKAQKQS